MLRSCITPIKSLTKLLFYTHLSWTDWAQNIQLIVSGCSSEGRNLSSSIASVTNPNSTSYKSFQDLLSHLAFNLLISHLTFSHITSYCLLLYFPQFLLMLQCLIYPVVIEQQQNIDVVINYRWRRCRLIWSINYYFPLSAA